MGLNKDILGLQGRASSVRCRLRAEAHPKPHGSAKRRSRGDNHNNGPGVTLDRWLGPLEASGYDHEATERETGVDASHMRRMVALMGRAEAEADRVRRDRLGCHRKPVTDRDLASVKALYVDQGRTEGETARVLGHSAERVAAICATARRRKLWSAKDRKAS